MSLLLPDSGLLFWMFLSFGIVFVILAKYGFPVIIKMVEAEETTKGGIILTGSAKEKPSVAEVISVGPGGNVDGKDIVMTVKVGDKVITSKYMGTEVKIDGEQLTIVKQSDVVAIVED